MSTISFSKKTAEAKPEAAADAAPAASEDKQIVPQAESQVAIGGGDTAFAGSWDRDDVRLPRINLVHKTSDSEMIEKFGIGGYAFNKEVKLGDGKKAIFVTALRAAKDYVQKLPFGSPEMPTIFKSPEEVTKNGGSLNYKDVDSGNFFGPRAHIQFVTAAPEGASEADLALFPYEFDGVSYGMAILTVASSAYTSVGKELATLCTNNKVMRKGMRFGALALTSETRTGHGKDWKVPVIKFTGENPAELVKFFEGLL